MPTKEENLEVAKLAKLIGSELNVIDRFSTERPKTPANRIDINRFIAQVVDPNRQAANASGYIPEALVQQMVPDAPQAAYASPPELIPMPEPPPQQQPPIIAAVVPPSESARIPTPPTSAAPSVYQQNSDIGKSLERIADAFEKMVDCYVKNNTIEEEEQVLNE